MRKILLTLVVTGAMISTSFSQTKKACKPEACGPNNTKVAEAKIITTLRGEVSELKSLIGQANLELQEASIGRQTIKNLPLDIQSNAEDASLLLLFMDVIGMKQTLNFSGASSDYSSKAQLVASLRKDLAGMKNQLSN